MSSHMISTLDLAKGAMHDVVVANSISMVLGSQVAQVVATGLGAVLYKIEELEDLLPMRGQELGDYISLLCFWSSLSSTNGSATIPCLRQP